jgi:hypothetical protein
VQGIWNGISAKGGWLWDKVTKFAKDFIMKPVDVLFQIFSPSRVFAEKGAYLVQGLANGIDSMSGTAAKAAQGMAQSVIDNFNVDPKELTNPIRTAVESAVAILGETEAFNPVITPVIDLSKVQKDAKLVNGLFGGSVSPNTSLSQANVISRSTNVSAPDSELVGVGGRGDVKFEQNIYAPQALSTADIYRQTRSQIALAKSELEIP